MSTIQAPVAGITPQIYTIVTRKSNDDKATELEIGISPYKTAFKMPELVFGKDMEKNANIIFSTFKRDAAAPMFKNTGTILTGQKGTGKSALAEIICNIALADGIPVLLINETWDCACITTAIKMLGRCVVFFDEYDKRYNSRSGIEEELLTLFSDNSLGGVKFMVTCNSLRDVSSFIVNRPSRFLFRIEFEGCEEKTVKQICKHYKVNKDITNFIVKHVAAVTECIDSVIALAREGAKFKTTEMFRGVFDLLNVKKPSFKIYSAVVQGVPHEEQNRFVGSIIEGKWSILDTVTGVTHSSKTMYARNGVATEYIRTDRRAISLEVSFVEHKEPQPTQETLDVQHVYMAPKVQPQAQAQQVNASPVALAG